MIKIEKIKIDGLEAALRGMRNPMDSWDLADSDLQGIEYMDIGPNDFKLMRQLIASGPDHRKFLRMITISMDITAPLYW